MIKYIIMFKNPGRGGRRTLAGGGMKNGQAIGRTGVDGMAVEDRPVTIPDLLATICRGLGIDPTAQNISNVGRPIRIVAPGTKAVEEALG